MLDVKPILSIVVPCYNEEEVLSETIKQLKEKLNSLQNNNKISKDSFILCVDDGSKDETWNILKNISSQDKFVNGIKLSTNYGHQNALLAGLTEVTNRCDCVISIDADLQQDINKFDEFIEKYLNGSKIVLGIRNDRKTEKSFRKITAMSYYKFMEIMGVKIIKNHADFRLLSNDVLLSLLQFKEVNLFLRGIFTNIGYSVDYVYFDVKNRFAGSSKYTLSKLLSLATNGITSFSTIPLKAITILGFLVSLMSVFMGLYVFVIYYLNGITVAGWSSTLISIWFLGGIQLFSIGIIGEYLGKTYLETKSRPRYIIESKTGFNLI